VSGWAFDRSNPAAASDVHIYIGGQAGTAGVEGFNIGAVTDPRPDVATAYPGAGEAHGFSRVLTTSLRGSQSIYMYGINLAGTPGTNVLLGSKTIAVS
jgi:hypothetical protein